MYQKSPTVTFACARSPCIHPQAEEVRQHKAARHQAFVDRHESAIANAVPLGVRLQVLLSEARHYEQSLLDRSDSPLSSYTIKKRQCVDAGYRNLILDVKRRAAIIGQQDTPAEHQFMLGSEAIGCFSSMLPWTDGIVSISNEPVMTPVAYSAPSFNLRDGRPAPMTNRRRLDFTKSATRSPSADSSSAQWTFPSRLATDTRKLAQITAARRKRLQSLAVSSPRGASVAELPLDNCRAQTISA